MTQQIVEGAASNRVFFNKNLRHVEYGLQARECKKMLHAILDKDIFNKEKTASNRRQVV